MSEELSPFVDSDMDTLVLGCTHYPLLQRIIQDYLGNDLMLINPGIEVAKQVQSILIDRAIFESGEKASNHVFYTSGDPVKFNDIAIHWLKRHDFDVKHIAVEELEKYGK